MSNNADQQYLNKSLHDLANSLTVVRTALYNIQEILPALLAAYKVGLECKPEACTKIQEDHIALLVSSIQEAMAESAKLKANFEQFKMDLQQ